MTSKRQALVDQFRAVAQSCLNTAQDLETCAQVAGPVIASINGKQLDWLSPVVLRVFGYCPANTHDVQHQPLKVQSPARIPTAFQAILGCFFMSKCPDGAFIG